MLDNMFRHNNTIDIKSNEKNILTINLCKCKKFLSFSIFNQLIDCFVNQFFAKFKF
jgi:hypothetical protein